MPVPLLLSSRYFSRIPRALSFRPCSRSSSASKPRLMRLPSVSTIAGSSLIARSRRSREVSHLRDARAGPQGVASECLAERPRRSALDLHDTASRLDCDGKEVFRVRLLHGDPRSKALQVQDRRPVRRAAGTAGPGRGRGTPRPRAASRLPPGLSEESGSIA